MKEYWEILRELREDKDLSQSAIAKALGTTQQVYSRYEKGINEMPIKHLRTLCQYYHVSADYVLGLSKHMAINVAPVKH
ncbi:MAG: helix-turn-helix domain-containing protein [Oscillospiraceae bacterium]|nr:helix-turn-helix domain-containing protein [Oscillospiraceae bacterium]